VILPALWQTYMSHLEPIIRFDLPMEELWLNTVEQDLSHVLHMIDSLYIIIGLLWNSISAFLSILTNI
jgi:hypothetical protein